MRLSQHDILCPNLTVGEHLKIFARLKGLDPTTCVNEKIAEVGLTEKTFTKAGELSGGMKRKLSLCMALIGDAKVIFLDEPTSGMDPFSRRSTWNMLQANRAGRAMVLTTHFMDEADLLGDRIAILAEGELQCCGSSLFLKNRFGAGYRLICSRGTGGGDGGDGTASCDATQVEALLRQHVTTAKLLTDVGAEMTYQLPTDSVACFPAMLRELQRSKAQLGVQEYGLAQVTMEEVFLKAGQSSAGAAAEGHGGVGDTPPPSLANEDDVLEASGDQRVDTMVPIALNELRPHQIFAIHLKALFLKRVHYGKRDYCSIFCSVLLPAFMLCGCLALVSNNQNKAPALVTFDTSQFAQWSSFHLCRGAREGPHHRRFREKHLS
eukprot:COSAG02_NODE_11099_length_1793_cov_1.088548_1_plen_379_part_00